MTNYVQKNRTLRKLNEDYDITDKLQKEAGKLPSRLGGAAGTLRDIGLGIVELAVRAAHDPRPDGVPA